jgi:hypothetical protein
MSLTPLINGKDFQIELLIRGGCAGKPWLRDVLTAVGSDGSDDEGAPCWACGLALRRRRCMIYCLLPKPTVQAQLSITIYVVINEWETSKRRRRRSIRERENCKSA